jgi:hypothetical protein
MAVPEPGSHIVERQRQDMLQGSQIVEVQIAGIAQGVSEPLGPGMKIMQALLDQGSIHVMAD